MKTLKTLWALALTSCALWSGGVAAQTISQPAGSVVGGGFDNGQSFTATVTGNVIAISVSPASSAPRTLHFYQGAAGSGALTFVGSPVYSQAITLVATPPGVFQRIDLTTPFPVVAGDQYSFVVEGSTSLRQSPSDVYPDGTRLALFAAQISVEDLAFEVFETSAAPTATNPSAIPSSSEWSLIGASLFVLAAALFHRRRSGTRQR